MEKEKILNPITKRYVHVGSQQFNKLLMEGLIKPVDEIEPVLAPAAEPVAETEPPPVKGLLAETMATIVKENKPLFQKELTQKQCDALFRKLLYEKLSGMKEPEPKKDKTKPEKKKEKPKKKKKAKYKMVTPPPSSDDSSDSD